jgi:hypothetical protein
MMGKVPVGWVMISSHNSLGRNQVTGRDQRLGLTVPGVPEGQFRRGVAAAPAGRWRVTRPETGNREGPDLPRPQQADSGLKGA